MDARPRTVLPYVGVNAALVAAGLHLYWGLPRFIIYAGLGRIPDPRPLAFVLSAVAIGVAVVILYKGKSTRVVYGFLVLVMLLYLFGYAWWHLTDHGGGLSSGLQPIVHDGSPLAILVDHLRTDRFGFVTVIVEFIALVTLLPLVFQPND